MPDLNNFAVTRAVAVNANVPSHQITGTLTDSSTGKSIADYTGPNALSWPAVLATLTVAQQDEIVGLVANRLIEMKAGL
jgi:hypothetical protein